MQKKPTIKAPTKQTANGSDGDDYPPRFIGKPEVLYRTNLSYPTVWKKMRDGTFPRSRDVGGKSAWLESEINDWIENRPVITLKGEQGPQRSGRVGGFADHPHPRRAKAEA